VVEGLREIRFHLSLPAEDCQLYYSGRIREVVTTSLDGRTVRFPARVLQRFITRMGVHGTFMLRYDSQGRFHSIERLD
jgi:hypothetical protein